MIEVGSREWIRATLALSLGSFLVFLNLYQTHPLLPLLAEVFSVSSLSAGWTLAGCTAGLAVSLLVCARLADRFGRRRIMLWSLAGAILLSLLISLVSQFEQLLLLRILQGVLLAGLPATAIAYMGEEFSKRALLSAVGVYIAANSLGGIAGRVVGGLLAGWFGDWQHTFLGIGLISLALLPLVIWLLPAQTRFVPVIAKPGQFRQAIASHLGNPLLVGAYLIGGLNFMVFLNQYSYLTFLLASPLLLADPMARHAVSDLSVGDGGLLPQRPLCPSLGCTTPAAGRHSPDGTRQRPAAMRFTRRHPVGPAHLEFRLFPCPRLRQRLGRPTRGAQPGARLVALSGGLLSGGQSGRAISESLLGAGGLGGLVLGIELVLVITAGLSLWLGHLKGRPARPRICHP